MLLWLRQKYGVVPEPEDDSEDSGSDDESACESSASVDATESNSSESETESKSSEHESESTSSESESESKSSESDPESSSSYGEDIPQPRRSVRRKPVVTVSNVNLNILRKEKGYLFQSQPSRIVPKSDDERSGKSFLV